MTDVTLLDLQIGDRIELTERNPDREPFTGTFLEFDGDGILAQIAGTQPGFGPIKWYSMRAFNIRKLP